ncbi:MAG: bifunctional 3-deoxy-7-phosphoheptulonate synthase/chorismate mutase type II [Bacteroidales bacterium]|jgi:chorismate mutase|nr:bifunctional 3-deoxy-7-phosphoheptulonate synthase/chorismate mutase type II [Bacteroidales bacterium]
MIINLNITGSLISGVDCNKPLIMAGPCSAETEEQVMAAARELAGIGVKIFRAGIWKPRTRPNAFEGVGSAGLPWLRRVKEETGMRVAIEVANVKHVYEALKNNIDVLWIGARTSANPFAVQEIADSLRGVDITVLVKNPVNPDVELWIGALERINAAGITHLGAIHRGFSDYGKSAYRNNPQWQIPIELRRRIPNLPIIVDPSHIAGKRDLIMDLCQTAMDLDFDGLIIESHCDPDNAWSDAAQQIVPQHLEYIIKNLILRSQDVDNKKSVTLEELRVQIDKLDDEVLRLMEQRMAVAEKIGQFKKENNVTILQSSRWDELLKQRINIGLSKGLSADFIQKVYTAIHEESIQHQKAIMNKNSK